MVHKFCKLLRNAFKNLRIFYRKINRIKFAVSLILFPSVTLSEIAYMFFCVCAYKRKDWLVDSSTNLILRFGLV